MGARGLGNLIGVMEHVAPKRLDELRSIVPNAKNWLKSEVDWSTLFDKDDPEQSQAILLLSEHALQTFEPLLQMGLKKCRSRIKVSQWLSMGGKVTSVLGSCGTIGLIMTASNLQENSILVSSVVTLIGALVSIVVQFLHEDINGTEKGVYKQFSTLKELSWKVKVVLAKVRVVNARLGKGLTATDIAVIQDANSLAGETYDALETLGLSVNDSVQAGPIA